MTNALYEDLGMPVDDAPPEEEDIIDGSEEEVIEDSLSPEDKDFIDQIVLRTIIFCEELSGMELRPYQRQLAYRIVESVIIGDGEEITALWSRQSGKSQTLAIVVAGMLVLFPKLAMSFPEFDRFKRGLWVGMFAPVDGQSEFIFQKVKDILTSDHAKEFLQDPEIDEKVSEGAKLMKLRSGSMLRRQTANPKAKIEGASYHLIVVDEAQDADDTVVRKSIHPMLAAYAGSIVKIGTPTFHKGDFYKAIQLNKRRSTKRGAKVCHYEYDWKTVAKYNEYYAKFIKKEKIRLGEDSDEFMMCVAPDTRVLTADLRHIPALDVYQGMELVGFDEDRPGKGLHRNFKKSVVEAVKTIYLPSYRLTMSDGTSVVCSEDHLWLVMTAGGRTEWKYTRDLTKFDRIFKLTDVWDTADDYKAGYLAAAFDGEGHLSHQPFQMGFSQKDNAMLEAVTKYLAEYGFAPNLSTNHTSQVHRLNISSRAEIMRFLGEIRPKRLLEKLDLDRIGSIGRHDRRSGGFDHPHVTGLDFLGKKKVVAFRTSTRTFVAEGLASHNSYSLKWMLDRGMLVTDEALDYLADPSMQLVKGWHRSPVVVGIDPARINDSTVVTVCWVDWDHPDAAGYREHRILNWLEIQNTDYEEQYYEIVEFLDNYDVAFVGVDAQGMGGPIADRLKRLMGHRTEVVEVTSDLKNQSDRWKHLIQLLQRNMVIYPGHSKARRTRVWKRFRQQMEDAEKVMKNNHLLVQAPDDSRDAHDDYVDSLAIACMMTQHDSVPDAEVTTAPWFR